MYVMRMNVDGQLIQTIDIQLIQTTYVKRENIDGKFICTIDGWFIHTMYSTRTNIDGKFIQTMYPIQPLYDVTSTEVEISTMHLNIAH